MSRLCLNCEKADMIKGKRDVTAHFSGFSEVVPAVYGWHCPKCGEVEFLDDDGSDRFEAAMDQLAARQRLWLRATRKKLKLTQAEAAVLTGGGVNAFSRYERGETKPIAAVVNLFRVLEKHPELLDEVRHGPRV